jgi:hypothetical protein
MLAAILAVGVTLSGACSSCSAVRLTYAVGLVAIAHGLRNEMQLINEWAWVRLSLLSYFHKVEVFLISAQKKARALSKKRFAASASLVGLSRKSSAFPDESTAR